MAEKSLSQSFPASNVGVEQIMHKVIGDKNIFAFEVGDIEVGSSDLRLVNIWGEGKLLTPVDNTAYLPSFTYSIFKDIEQLKNHPSSLSTKNISTVEDAKSAHFHELTDIAMKHWFLDYGETTDDVRAFLFKTNKNIFITFELDGLPVFCVQLLTEELILILTETYNYLQEKST